MEELERTVEPTWSKLVEPLVRIEDRLYDVSAAVFHLTYVKHHIELRDALIEVLVHTHILIHVQMHIYSS